MKGSFRLWICCRSVSFAFKYQVSLMKGTVVSSDFQRLKWSLALSLSNEETFTKSLQLTKPQLSFHGSRAWWLQHSPETGNNLSAAFIATGVATKHQRLISICVGPRINITEFGNLCISTKLMGAACKIWPAMIKALDFWLF